MAVSQTAGIVKFDWTLPAPTVANNLEVPLFQPTPNPSFDYAEPFDIQVDVVRTNKGYDTVRPLGVRPVRQPVRLRWNALNESQRDYIVSFFAALNGTNGPFWWTPLDKVAVPQAKPTLTQVSGGSLAARTYYVVYAWYHRDNGETTQSERHNLTLRANNFLKVEVPVIPSGAEGFRVYAHETSGSEVLQATVLNSRTWTQAAALATGTASPPSTNTLSSPIKWRLQGAVQPVRIRANRWSLDLTFMEQLA